MLLGSSIEIISFWHLLWSTANLFNHLDIFISFLFHFLLFVDFLFYFFSLRWRVFITFREHYLFSFYFLVDHEDFVFFFLKFIHWLIRLREIISLMIFNRWKRMQSAVKLHQKFRIKCWRLCVFQVDVDICFAFNYIECYLECV